MIQATPYYQVDSILFGSANGSEVRVMLPKDSYEEKGLMSGYALPRVQFDYMMFKRASEIVKENGGSVIQGFTVKEVLSEGSGPSSRITGVTGKFGGAFGQSNDDLQFNGYYWGRGL